MSVSTIILEETIRFINIAAYKFAPLKDLTKLRTELLTLGLTLDLKGTILLSFEGINLFLAGTRESVDSFLKNLRARPEFAELEVKESISDHQPFNRMLVRMKKEIIAMGVPEIRPLVKTSPKISAHQLKQWLDEGKELTLLDVRNDYEIEVGTFGNAIPIGLDHFRDFPDALQKLPTEIREKPMVMFCTGGIRCEKAGPITEQAGFKEVYQLDGGILKYFEECGGAHYKGDCFVFDKRVALDPQLNETDLALCYHCQAILTVEDQQSTFYAPPQFCPHCHPDALPLNERLERRATRLREETTPLPGSTPYVNSRPMSVRGDFDRKTLLEFLTSVHPALDQDYWTRACAEGRVQYKGKPLDTKDVVRAGWRLYHMVPNTVEPDVSNEIEFLYEDHGLIAIRKPAPLPMHPCGRFNKNSLQYFLRLAYPHETIRILHRLDAETTGVLLLGRDRPTSVRLQQQFSQSKVRKTYLARVHGHPNQDAFECDAIISDRPAGPGGIREVIEDQDSEVLPLNSDAEVLDHTTESGNGPAKKKKEKGVSLTRFEVVKRMSDNTTLLRCYPVTGRTNQIRVHLSYLGFPIVGDIGYGSAKSIDNRSGLHLHAWTIEFEYPKGTMMRLEAKEPDWAVV